LIGSRKKTIVSHRRQPFGQPIAIARFADDSGPRPAGNWVRQITRRVNEAYTYRLLHGFPFEMR
jgi:hypothetical protein